MVCALQYVPMCWKTFYFTQIGLDHSLPCFSLLLLFPTTIEPLFHPSLALPIIYDVPYLPLLFVFPRFPLLELLLLQSLQFFFLGQLLLSLFRFLNFIFFYVQTQSINSYNLKMWETVNSSPNEDNLMLNALMRSSLSLLVTLGMHQAFSVLISRDSQDLTLAFNLRDNWLVPLLSSSGTTSWIVSSSIDPLFTK